MSDDALAPGARFAIVRATFYDELAERLTQGALRGFAEAGVDDTRVEVFDVPGAFELPFAARECALTGRFKGIACLGAVIRGETDHYTYVCEGAAHGVQRVQLDTGVPCSFGVLTVESMDQALARSGGEVRDSGHDAASTVVHMARLAAASR